MNALLGMAGAAVAAIVALLLLRRGGQRDIDHGTVSDAWIAEQKMAPKDHLSS